MLPLIFYQKKKLKKPKENASPSSESFDMHFSLRGMARKGDRKESREGTNSSDVRSGLLLNFCRSYPIRGECVFHDSVVRTGKTGGAKQDEENCNIWITSCFSFFSCSCFVRGNTHRFSKCFTASFLFHTHHDFNSKAAEVISSLLIPHLYKVT